MKKAFGQTVREIKREVNKKVLKVPGVEQKVLDATSNEPWGPHGTLLADIAQASRNYHEYQMIMQVIWKRINDTGKNWRHVYKGLTVLEYLVAHGSERVIDDIREHAYQISTLSDFQYIDSNGRDQGSNVRKKSQSLVVLVNDKDRIQEVRQKAAANRDKFRNTSMGGMSRPGSGGFGDDDRYGGRDDDRNGYGREREYGDDRYGRDADRRSRDSDERYSRDDDYRGRSQSVDGDRYNSRSRSSDREKDRSFEDDGQYSSRGSGAQADDRSQDGSVSGNRIARKFSEPNLSAPPSYEEAVGEETQSPAHSERGGEVPVATAPKSPVTVSTSPTSVSAPPASASPPAPAPAAPASVSPPASSPANQEMDGFDEFDPRGPFSANPTPNTSINAEMDLLGSLSDAFSPNPLAIMPATPETAVSDTDASASFNSGTTFAAASSASQPFDDPFGDGPFRAITTSEPAPAQTQTTAHASSFSSLPDLHQSTTNPYGEVPPTMTTSFSAQDFSTSSQDFDILADILPPSGPSPPVTSQANFPPQQQANFPPQQQPSFPPQQQANFPPQQQANFSPQQQANFPPQQQANFPPQQQTNFPPQQQANFPPQQQTSFPPQQMSVNGYSAQAGPQEMQTSFPPQAPLQNNYVAQSGFPGQAGAVSGFPGQVNSVTQTGFGAPTPQPVQQSTNYYGNYLQQQQAPGASSVVPHTTPSGPTQQYNNSNFYSQTNNSGFTSTAPSQPTVPASTALALVPHPAKDSKFETKSTVWADTLSRGLVNLNISGPKTNPLSDIGVDFDAINRREKRMEKPTTAAVTSTITMGKAMGSGTGMGRAGAGALRPAPNPMGGMGGMGGGGGGYGGGNMGMGMNPNQHPMGMNMNMGGGQNMGMGMNMGGPNMGMGMNMGMGQGGQPPMQPMGYPPGSMPAGYNPMMGQGGGYQQQPYGGGYR